MTVYLINERKETEKEYPNRAEAEEQREKLIELGMKPENVRIQPDNRSEEPKSDGGEAEVVEPSEGATELLEASDHTDLPDEKPGMDVDPVDWLPGHFVDTIQGVPTLNRKGYAVMCERFGVSVTSEPVTLPSETDFEYAEFKATAVTEDGTEYSGFGSAHVDRQDGDDKHLLAELAETRAMKRAAAWATGIGMTAAEEMQGEL
jgi:hypothetical protein